MNASIDAIIDDGFFITDDGLNLHYRQYKPISDERIASLPVICLPGLTRNVRDFDRLGEYLTAQSGCNFHVIALDYRGRGQSDWDDNQRNYNIVREANDVIQMMAHLNLSRASFIGTSRGGLILHILATLRLEAISAIIFNDIGPEIELAGLLDIQKYLEKPKSPKNWHEAAAMQKQIHGMAFPKLTEDDWRDMAREIYIEKDGKIVSDCDPAVVKSIQILDTQTELPTLWEQFRLLYDVPILTIRGANSLLFSQKTLNKMDKTHPNHQKCVVDDQGHPPILHTPSVKEKIVSFLTSLDQSEQS